MSSYTTNHLKDMAASELPNAVRCILQPDRHTETVYLTKIPIQLPKLGTTEHLIKVKCVAPCADELTWAKTDGHLMDPDRVDVPCFDMSGIVVSAPSDSPFHPGSEVFTHTDGLTTGNAREYSIARTENLALKPKNLSWEEAASVSVSALTAYQALFTHGQLGWKGAEARAANASKRILITAAAGGVGVWALQLAKAAGVGEIIAVNGTSNVDLVKSLGATRVVDYRKQSLGTWAAAEGAKVDLVLDMVGGQTLTDAWSMVEEGGHLISVIVRDPDTLKPKDHVAKGVKSLFFILDSIGAQLKEVAELLENGLARTVVDSVWEFDQYREAFAKLAEGHAKGKVIIRLS